MMASGKKSKQNRKVVPVVTRKQGLPWLTIAAVAVILVLAGGIFLVVFNKAEDNASKAEALAPFTPTAENMDPSTAIPDIYIGADPVVENNTISYPAYQALLHVKDGQRVDYDRFPPVGGPHDEVWAACDGAIYSAPVRNENMVHPLEHGAVWIAYNPETISSGDLDILKTLVEKKTYMLMSPYPGLDRTISLQAWGHQLKVDSASDVRIQQFITALRNNVYITPERNARCDQPGFSLTSPPPLDTTPVDPATATPMDGGGLTPATDEDHSIPTGSSDPSATESSPESSAATTGDTSTGDTTGDATTGATTTGGTTSS